MTENPLVSVIICTYNAGSFLEPSVRSILDQAYTNLEIIIVDDGSTDGSLDSIGQIKDERIRLISQANAGKSMALNRAIGELSGEFYAVHDSDDFSHPLRIQRQLEAFQRGEDLAAVYCGHELIMNEKRYAPRFREKDREACRRDIGCFRMPAHDPTGMYRVSMVGETRYEPSLEVGEGLDYILRVGEKFPILVVGECLYSYRIHRESLTKRVAPNNRKKQIRKVYLRACERRGIAFEDVFSKSSSTRLSNKDIDNGVAVSFIESVVDLCRAERRLEAIYNGACCAMLFPMDMHYYKALVYALMPVSLRQWVRPSERIK